MLKNNKERSPAGHIRHKFSNRLQSLIDYMFLL